jgi:hypothetical protein
MGSPSSTGVFEVGEREALQDKRYKIDDGHLSELDFDGKLDVELNSIPQFNDFPVFLLQIKIVLDLLLFDAFFEEGHGGLLLFDLIIALFTSNYRLLHAIIAISSLDNLLDCIHVCIFEHDEELFQYFRHESCDLRLGLIELGYHFSKFSAFVHVESLDV